MAGPETLPQSFETRRLSKGDGLYEVSWAANRTCSPPAKVKSPCPAIDLSYIGMATSRGNYWMSEGVDAAETRVRTVVAPTGSARETVSPLEMAFEVIALAP
jgi:hypothetical protein